MGTNVSKTVETITNSVANIVDQSAASSANATCSVTTGNIVLKNSKNSSVTNENKCGVSASAALDATADAAADAYMTATSAQKSALLSGVNVNSTKQDIKNEILNQITQKCQANASTTLSIANGDITIDGCENVQIKNLNFGDATANCGLKSVINSTLSATTDTTTDQESESLSLLDTLFGDYLYYVLGASALSSFLCCCCCIILIIGMVFMVSGPSSK
jgi:cobalamin biosynthesis Mg chelatase CobN